jgi:hypothetical protein
MLLNNFYRTRNNPDGAALGRFKERGNPMAPGTMTTAMRVKVAAGLATPEAIRTRLAGAGRTDIDPNAATMRMNAVVT